MPRRWVLVDAAPTILPESRRRLGEYAVTRARGGRGVEIHVGYDGRVAFEGGTSTRRAVTTIATNTLVWTAGVRSRTRSSASSDCLSTSVVASPSTSSFASTVTRMIWALGDCASVPNRSSEPGPFDPPTSQHALRQARRLAKNLRGDLKPYGYRMLGQVATLGRYKGIADVLGPSPARLPRLVRHADVPPLLSCRSSQRKLRVVADWTTSLLFRRDIAELCGPRPARLDRARLSAQRSDFERLGQSAASSSARPRTGRRARDPVAHGVHRERGGSSSSSTSSQRSGVDTGAPASGAPSRPRRSSSPRRSGSRRSSTPRRFDFVHSVVARPRCVRAIAPATISANCRVSS